MAVCEVPYGHGKHTQTTVRPCDPAAVPQLLVSLFALVEILPGILKLPVERGDLTEVNLRKTNTGPVAKLFTYCKACAEVPVRLFVIAFRYVHFSKFVVGSRT